MGGVLLGLRIASWVNVRARPLVVCLLLGPGLSVAQNLPISLSGGVIVNGVNRFGPVNCGGTLTVQWGIPSPAQITPCSNPEFWITAGTCGDHPDAGDPTLTPAQSQSVRSGTFDPVNISDLPIFQGTDGGVCGNYPRNSTLYACGSVVNGSPAFGCGSTSIVRGTNPSFQYRGSPPPAPTSFDVTGLDGALRVNVSAGSDVNQVHVELRVAGAGDFAEVAMFSPDQGSVKISGLVNGTAYEVRAFDDDGVGNFSDRTGVLTATPVATEGFYEVYRRLGGTDTGGCGAAFPSAFGLPIVFGVYRLLRRKR